MEYFYGILWKSKFLIPLKFISAQIFNFHSMISYANLRRLVDYAVVKSVDTTHFILVTAQLPHKSFNIGSVSAALWCARLTEAFD